MQHQEKVQQESPEVNSKSETSVTNRHNNEEVLHIILSEC